MPVDVFSYPAFKISHSHYKEWFASANMWRQHANNVAGYNPREGAIIRDIANSHYEFARLLQQWEQGK